jgi:hypothetical protein
MSLDKRIPLFESLKTLNESIVSFDSMKFNVSVFNDSRGTYIQFIPDSKTLDIEQSKVLNSLNSKLSKSQISSLFEYNQSHAAAGYVFKLNNDKLHDELIKIIR